MTKRSKGGRTRSSLGKEPYKNLKVEVKVTYAPAFVELMVAGAREVLKDTSKKVRLKELPEFIAFFSQEKPQSYFHDVTPYLDITEGGIYIEYAPLPGENPMTRFAMK